MNWDCEYSLRLSWVIGSLGRHNLEKSTGPNEPSDVVLEIWFVVSSTKTQHKTSTQLEAVGAVGCKTPGMLYAQTKAEHLSGGAVAPSQIPEHAPRFNHPGPRADHW